MTDVPPQPAAKLVPVATRHSIHPLVCREGSSDFLSFQQVFVKREYSCMDDLVDPRLILDCGANAGYASAYFLNRFPRCQVIAVEPDPDNFAVLRRNLAPYGERVRTIRAAVWSRPAALKMSEATNQRGREWGRQVRECGNGEAGDLPTVDVGSLLRESGFESISILKVDIEASEKVVFGDGCETWIGRVENIVVELHDAECVDVFRRAIAGQGFEVEQRGELTVCKRRQGDAGRGSALEAVDLLAQQAMKHHQGGDPQAAVPFYRRVVEADPSQTRMWYLLGAACEALGRLDEAEASLLEALRMKADDAEAHNHLGVVHARQGRTAEAALHFREALWLQPGHTRAQENLRNARLQQGVGQDGAGPSQPPPTPTAEYRALLEQGRGLREQGKFQEASDRIRQALHLHPDGADGYNALAVTLLREGKGLAVVAPCLRESLRLNPQDARTHLLLGNLYRTWGKPGEAQASYEQTLRLRPDSLDARLGMGDVCTFQGRPDQALTHYREALRLRPDSVAGRFGACFASLGGVYDDEDEVTRRREDYRRALETLAGDFPFDRPEAVVEAVEALGRWTPFFLPYQGRDDRDLQALYGRFASRVLAARFPQWTASPAVPPPAPGERIRVGVVSAFMYRHSNWKMRIRGWAQNLDRRKIELFGYHLGAGSDSETVAARRLFDHFTEKAGSLEDWVGVLARDRLHVLLYPELGMFPLTLQLAALRLAPVQCVSWSHPITSGLPTIDYFLSSDLMEPADAQRQYTEELVRFPNLGVYYNWEIKTTAPLDLAAYGVRPNAIRYLCCQMPAKYLPQHDALLCRIAAQAPEAQFLFLWLNMAHGRAEQLRSRLSRAFAVAGLDADRHLVFLPHLDDGQYKALNQAADVFLDSVGWSGCNTTLEALACGLPVVTLPGALMRGRHSLGILRRMGVTETVADNADDYVAKAVALGRDRAAREAVRARVTANRHKVYRDLESVRALEEFFERAVVRRSPSAVV